MLHRHLLHKTTLKKNLSQTDKNRSAPRNLLPWVFFCGKTMQSKRKLSAMPRKLFILAFLFLATSCLPSQNITAGSPTVGTLSAFEDPAGHLNILDILDRKDEFQTASGETPNFLLTRSAWWFRIPVQYTGFENKTFYLDVLYPTLDDVLLFVVGADGPRGFQRTGDRIPAEARPFPDAMTLVVPFDLQAGESVDLYIRVRGNAQALLFPFKIRTEAELRKSLATERFIHGIMAGLFVALLTFNFFLYIMLREPSRLYFMAYLPFVFLAFTALDGFGPTVIYPDNTWFVNEGLVFFHGLSSIFILLFTRVFLRTEKGVIFDRGVKAVGIISILLVLSAFLIPVRQAYLFSASMLLVTPLVLMLLSFTAWRRGKTEVRFYVLAQSASFLGGLLFVLMVSGILPFSKWFLEAIPIGVCTGALMHSLAIADRIRILEQKNKAAEETARRNLELRQEELETLVAQRTHELETARREAERQATTDALTGIFNRRGLLADADRAMKLTLRYGRPLSLAMFDIDRFKAINDQYGHLEGDRILQEITRVVSHEIRTTDLFGRVGGEEFLIVMPDTPSQAASDLAERLRARIEENIRTGHPARTVTASFGVACLSAKNSTLRLLIEASDAALYKAKQNGRNRVEIDDPQRTFL